MQDILIRTIIKIIEKLIIYSLISVLLTTIHLVLLVLLSNNYNNFVSDIIYNGSLSHE